MKQEIFLSHKAIAVINEHLSNGDRVQIDFDPRTRELKIFEVPRMKTKYRVVIADGR